MNYTHIVFVGHHKERLMESITRFKKHPLHRVILVIGVDEISGEKISRKVAMSVRNELTPLCEVSITKVDKRNVMVAAAQIVDIIQKEESAGNTCVLNMSGSLRTYAVAAYIAGCLTRTMMFTSIPRYNEQDQEVGVDEIIDLPAIPVEYPKKDQVQLLESIRTGSGFLEDLILQFNPELDRTSDEFSNERSRLTHHLKKLEDRGFVIKEKSGKNVLFRLSPLGEVVDKVCEG